jgi:TctA family transporter
MIILQAYSFVAPLFTGRILDYYLENNINSLLGLSFGELAFLLSLIPMTIEIIAYIILTVGLYRKWESKKAVQKIDCFD